MEATKLKSFLRTGKELGLQALLENTIGDEVSRVVENSTMFFEPTEERLPTELNEATSHLRPDIDTGPHIDSELFVDKKSAFDSNVVDHTSEEALFTEVRKAKSKPGVDKNPAAVSIETPAPPVPDRNLTKTDKQVTDWKCVHCSMTISSELRLKAHMTNKHRSEAICETCGFKTLRWDHLRKHKTNVHGPPGETTLYKCDQCPYLANQLISVRTHKQIKHENLRYRCDQCDNSFTTKNNLLKHIKSKHA